MFIQNQFYVKFILLHLKKETKETKTRMNKRISTFALAAMLMTGFASAQTNGAWTLQDCINYALQHNIQLQKNRASEQTADIAVKQAKAGLLPSLNASTTQGLTYRPFQETGGNIVNGGITSSAADKAIQSGSYGINASWTVWDGGQKRLNIKNSELSRQEAEYATETTASSIQEQIAQIYVQILYLREAEKINKELLKQDSIVFKRGEQMKLQGQVSKSEVAQLQAQVSTARYNVVNIQTQIANYKTQLKQLLEITTADDIDIADIEVTDESVLRAIPSKMEVYTEALSHRPEIKSSELSIEQSKLATKIAKAGYFPTISMTGGLGDSHVTGTQTNFFDQMKNNFNANVGVSVSIPIFDNRQNKSAVEKAQVQEVTSQLDLLDAQKSLYTTIETYWLNATNNQEKFRAAKDNTESVQMSYDLLQEQFKLGVKNIADLLTSRANLLTAKQSMIQDKYTTVLNRALLDFYADGTISL